MNEKKIAEGTLSITAKGMGLVNIEEFEHPIEIAEEKLKNALHKDLVSIEIYPEVNKWGKYAGGILEIVKPGKRSFTGRVVKKGAGYIVVADDTKMTIEINIDTSCSLPVEAGDKVLVELLDWAGRGEPLFGCVKETFGKHGTHEAEMQAIARDQGFSSAFPKDVMDEATSIKAIGVPEDEYKNRRDIRQITTFTIDPKDAKDFDDALSYRQLPNGLHEVGIHIADVSFFLKEGGALDKEAYERATSVYLVDRTIPMLPPVLSDDLCSLNAHEDKLTYSAIVTLDDNANVVGEWFGRTVINSDKRFTYEEAQEILDKNEGIFIEELTALRKLSRALGQKRKDNFALTLEQDEVKFVLNEDMKPVSVYIKPRIETNNLIEEFMLLANVRVAEYISKDESGKMRLGLYRVHDAPTIDKIDDLVYYLNLFGYKLHRTPEGSVTGKEIAELVKKIADQPEKNTLMTHIVRSMQKAFYTTKEAPHFGLAFTIYTHFTSPIRRYADVIVHRLITEYINHNQIPEHLWSQYEKMAGHCSEQERFAQNAERGSVKYKQAEYMSERIGKTFTGLVTGLARWGVYVEEKETKSEGLVQSRDDKGNQILSISEDGRTVTHLKSGKIIKAGDEIQILVSGVNMDKKQIDYSIVVK